MIPLKEKEYLKFPKTLSTMKLFYGYKKNTIENGAHHALFCTDWGALKISISINLRSLSFTYRYDFLFVKCIKSCALMNFALYISNCVKLLFTC